MSNNLNDNSRGVPQAAVGYFVDQKKGEVNELKQLLKNFNVEKDMKRKREIIKKVIAYMTLGIDVSRLFTEMIMAIETKDIVIKKMVYHYLCTYAQSNPEMAIMCINSLRRDCDNEDPLVRGLALRSLCGLRMESILEYIDLPLKKSLDDLSSYVRKTGIMGILKVQTISPTLVENNNYMEKLYSMLEDVDGTVVMNAIFALDELLLDKGGIELSQERIMMLLNRVGEFSEWGLNKILELTARYAPSNPDECYSIMNLLDPVLRTANSGAVLSTLKCFVSLTKQMPDMHTQIYERVKPPILTLVTGASPESQFAMLKHLELILNQPAAQGVFDEEYRQIFVRYNEPPHVKHLKVELLPYLANDSNAIEIASELQQYVTDIDAELSKRAIKAIAEVATKVPGVAVEMTQTLMELMDMDVVHVRSQAAIVISDVVRTNNSIVNLVLPFLSKYLKKIEVPEARASLVFLLGEFGTEIVDAPYLLEPIIDSFADEASVTVKLNTLSAAMKLFFKRPPEMQEMLGRLLTAAANDTTYQDLHDRALLYLRLLSMDINSAQRLFGECRACDIPGNVFAEREVSEKKSTLFSEFNTLAVIYSTPSVQFIAEEYQLKSDDSSASQPEFDFNSQATAPLVPSSSSGPSSAFSPPEQQHQQQSHHPSGAGAGNGSVNLLDWDDAPAPAAAVQQQQQQLHFDDSINLTPADFQKMWGSLPEAFSGRACTLSSTPNAAADIETALRRERLVSIASGALPPAAGRSGVKLFVYGACNNVTVNSNSNDLLGGDDEAVVVQEFYMCQLIVYFDSMEVTAVVKTNSQSRPPQESANKLLHSMMTSLSAYGPMM